MRDSSRLSALDGLRGVAALVVVVHHCLLVSPSFAAAYYGDAPDWPAWRAVLVYTPLHMLWGGTEAVVVFFVLSGFVLARAVRSRRFGWFEYFPSRMLRLYMPVAGAVALGYLILLLPHDAGSSSPWLTDRPTGYPLPDVLRDLVLVNGTSGAVSPLWSLRWEVLFSLLLPVVAYAARLLPAWAFGLLCVALSTLGAATGVSPLEYLPIFGVGVALEAEWERAGRLAERMTRRLSWPVWAGAGIAAWLLLSMHWMLLAPLGYHATEAAAQAPIVIGAALLVFTVVHCRTLRRALSWRPALWLGGISFSLYLVHEPLVVWVGDLTGAARWTLPIAIPAAVALAWAFWIVVEHPAHRLARGVRAHAVWGIPDPATATQPPASESPPPEALAAAGARH